MEVKINWNELVDLIKANAQLPETIKSLEADADKIYATISVGAVGDLSVQARFAAFEAGCVRLILTGQGFKEQMLLGFSGLARTRLTLNAFMRMQGCDLWIDMIKVLESIGVKGCMIASVHNLGNEVLIHTCKVKTA